MIRKFPTTLEVNVFNDWHHLTVKDFYRDKSIAALSTTAIIAIATGRVRRLYRLRNQGIEVEAIESKTGNDIGANEKKGQQSSAVKLIPVTLFPSKTKAQTHDSKPAVNSRD